VRLLHDMRAAIGLLTLIPVGEHRSDARPAAWFPWVGLIFAALAVGVASAASVVIETDLGALLVGAIIVWAWAIASRMLHWDGLADTADALWGGHTPVRRLEIMRDSHVGSFGVVTVVFVALTQVICVAAVYASRDWWALGAAPILGRFAASVGVWSVPPARTEGLGASVATRPSWSEVLFAALAVGATLVVPCPERIALLAVGTLLALLVPRFIGRRVGGMTGDVLGASVMVVETAILVVAAVIGA